MRQSNLCGDCKYIDITCSKTGSDKRNMRFNGTEFLATPLHMSSSQKHILPVPVPSIMHTWSTMNRFIWSWDVQVRLTLSYAANDSKSKIVIKL